MRMHGVNLGGWFIPERWMTPALFNGIDAIDSMTLLATNEGKRRYLHHIHEFIDDKDIEFLSQNGVRILRVPVGWWMVNDQDQDEDEEVAQACITRLDWLFDFAEQKNLLILLDYHAARGSQNGKDHSGAVGLIQWKQYRAKNLFYLKYFAKRYSVSPALWGVELINEPVVKRQFWFLFRYYRAAKKQLRNVLSSDVRIVIHDGFMPLLFSHITPRRSQTVLDLHLYEIAVKKNESVDAYFDRRDARYRRWIHVLRHFQPVIVGEWSGVIPETFLKDISENERRKLINENISRQKSIYQEADASMFWSFKAADQMMWNFETSLRRK